MELEATPDVLIPRPETEHVIKEALARIGELRRTNPLRIADVGIGSGCIAVALAKEFPNANIFATDISSKALAVAKRNAPPQLRKSHHIHRMQFTGRHSAATAAQYHRQQSAVRRTKRRRVITHRRPRTRTRTRPLRRP